MSSLPIATANDFHVGDVISMPVTRYRWWERLYMGARARLRLWWLPFPRGKTCRQMFTVTSVTSDCTVTIDGRIH